MANKTQAEKMQEIYTALLGVPDTDNRGIAGDIRDINKHLEVLNDGQAKQNVKIATNTEAIKNNKQGIKRVYTLGGGLFTLLLLAVGVILKLVGVY